MLLSLNKLWVNTVGAISIIVYHWKARDKT